MFFFYLSLIDWRSIDASKWTRQHRNVKKVDVYAPNLTHGNDFSTFMTFVCSSRWIVNRKLCLTTQKPMAFLACIFWHISVTFESISNRWNAAATKVDLIMSRENLCFRKGHHLAFHAENVAQVFLRALFRWFFVADRRSPPPVITAKVHKL